MEETHSWLKTGPTSPLLGIIAGAMKVVEMDPAVCMDEVELECLVCDDKFGDVRTCGSHIKIAHPDVLRLRTEEATKTKEIASPDVEIELADIFGMDTVEEESGVGKDGVSKTIIGGLFESPTEAPDEVHIGFGDQLKMEEAPTLQQCKYDWWGRNTRGLLTCESGCSYKAVNVDEYYIHQGKAHLKRIDNVFSCPFPYCGQVGKRKDHMQNHVGSLKHTQERKYICDDCGAAFTLLKHLKEHIKHVHIGLQSHVCDGCGAAFVYKKSLKNHLEQEKPECLS